MEVLMFAAGKGTCGILHVRDCEPPCAILLSRAGQDLWEKFCPEAQQFTGDKRKARDERKAG